jgi:cytosine/adenosine deaminase-related metal-dependent hydrolase
MLLYNLGLIGSDEKKDILIRKGKIEDISGSGIREKIDKKEISIVFKDALAFPGLINSHDHLDFNLFPRTANRIYNNYLEWGNDIHIQDKKLIKQVLGVPLHMRIQWGIYKNLLNGITTVINHGSKLKIESEVIHVFQESNSLHSTGLEKGWRWKINRPFAGRVPIVIHIGEGTDEYAKKEIDKLIRWNFLKRKIIGIHGIAMDKRQAKYFHALVWCPESNLFLMNKTASVDELKEHVNIVFGTDSTLSSGWNIWEQLRLAKKLKSVSNPEILAMLTTVPAQVWGFEKLGKIKTGNHADIVIANIPGGGNQWDAFFSINPEDLLLVIQRGRIRLFDQSLSDVIMEKFPEKNFSKITIRGAEKWVEGDLPGLIKEIEKYLPAGKISFS